MHAPPFEFTAMHPPTRPNERFGQFGNGRTLRTPPSGIIPPKEDTTMRFAKLASALLGFAALLMAADPFAGTWSLNTAKTKYKTGAPAKEQTLTITETGSDLDVTIKGTAADGAAISSHYTVPAKGGEGKIVESPYDAVSGKRPSANQREISYSKGG